MVDAAVVVAAVDDPASVVVVVVVVKVLKEDLYSHQAASKDYDCCCY